MLSLLTLKMNWKLNFGNSFAYLVSLKSSNTTSNHQEAFTMFKDVISKNNCTRFWRDLSEIANTPASQLHDFFHNTWSKQFCSQLKSHKNEIIELVQAYLGKPLRFIV